jgi:hypothetical protein
MMRLSLLLLLSADVFANGFTASSASSPLCHGQEQQLQHRRCGGASILPFFRGGGLQEDDSPLAASPSILSSTCLASTTSSSTTDTSSAAAEKVISPANWELLSPRGRSALLRLIKHDLDHQHQTHVYGDWPEVGVEDEEKRLLAEQVSDKRKFRCVINRIEL